MTSPGTQGLVCLQALGGPRTSLLSDKPFASNDTYESSVNGPRNTTPEVIAIGSACAARTGSNTTAKIRVNVSLRDILGTSTNSSFRRGHRSRLRQPARPALSPQRACADVAQCRTDLCRVGQGWPVPVRERGQTRKRCLAECAYLDHPVAPRTTKLPTRHPARPSTRSKGSPLTVVPVSSPRNSNVVRRCSPSTSDTSSGGNVKREPSAPLELLAIDIEEPVDAYIALGFAEVDHIPLYARVSESTPCGWPVKPLCRELEPAHINDRGLRKRPRSTGKEPGVLLSDVSSEGRAKRRRVAPSTPRTSNSS